MRCGLADNESAVLDEGAALEYTPFMRAFFFTLFALCALQAQAQSSQPTKKLFYPYWSAAGYASLNAGLFYGAHALHAARDPNEEPEHVRFDAALADSLAFSGLSLMAVGYVARQRALSEDIIAPRLFYRTAALSAVSTVLFYSIGHALSLEEPEIAASAKSLSLLSLSFSVGSLTTAWALR